MVFLPGHDYKEGDPMLYPGHIVAEKEIVVITLGYRLGAIGRCNGAGALKKPNGIHTHFIFTIATPTTLKHMTI